MHPARLAPVQSRMHYSPGSVRYMAAVAILVSALFLSSCASGPTAPSTGTDTAPLYNAISATSEHEELFEEVERLLDEQKSLEAIALLTPYSDSDDGEIEHMLALSYVTLSDDGQTTESLIVDGAIVEPSIYWAEKAVSNENLESYNLLYSIYVHDSIVPQDIDKALWYLRKGAESGSVSAQLNLGMVSFDGDLMARDYAKACELLVPLLGNENAAPIASYYVGAMIYSGRCGDEPDKQGGMNLIEVAANFGIAKAQLDWGKSLEYGWIDEPDEIAAVDWYERAAENGSADAMWRMGMTYVQGVGRSKDSSRAVEYFQQSIDAGSINGLVSLGVMYAKGDGVEHDYVRTRELYEEAASYGSAHAMRGLGMMLFEGQGGPKDRIKGALLYEQSVELGNETAQGEIEDIRRDLSANEETKVKALLKDWLKTQ